MKGKSPGGWPVGLWRSPKGPTLRPILPAQEETSDGADSTPEEESDEG